MYSSYEVTSYYAKELIESTEFEFIKEKYREWHNLYIIVSKHEISMDEVNSIFSQITYLSFSNSLLDYLILKNIGFINLEMYFFMKNIVMQEGEKEKGRKF